MANKEEKKQQSVVMEIKKENSLRRMERLVLLNAARIFGE